MFQEKLPGRTRGCKRYSSLYAPKPESNFVLARQQFGDAQRGVLQVASQQHKCL